MESGHRAETLANLPCAARSLRTEVIESLVSLIEGDDRQSLRSKFRTGSLAVIDADTIRQVLARAPLRYAGYSGMRLLQRSASVSTVDLSSNTDCENLAKQACNPSYFPRVKLLRIRGAALGREALASLLSSPPPGLSVLDLANARIPSQPDWAPLASRRTSTLRQLSLAGTACVIGAGSRQLPSGLAVLDLSGCSGVRLGALLARCTSLQSLALAFSSVTVGSPSEEGAEAGWRGSSASRSAKGGGSGTRAASGRATAWAALADDSDDEDDHPGSRAGLARPGAASAGDTWGTAGAGGPVGEAAITAIATAPCATRLRALDIRGCQIEDPTPLVSLSSACATSMRLLDLRHAVVAPRCNAEQCIRGLAPMVGLRGLGLPAGLSSSLTLEGLLRALAPMRRLQWLAATVASLHVGSLAKERASAASAGVADPVTGAASEVARARMPAGTTSTLEAPWCSLRMLDAAVTAWVTDPSGRDDMTASEARVASETAAALAAAGMGSAGSRQVQDVGPVLAAMPQLCRLRISGAGSGASSLASSPGKLVWARGLTQYARVLASGWRELGEVAGAAGKVPSLRRELSVTVLRQALARSPLAELSLDGVPGVHDRVLLLAGCLPRLAHFRLQPCSGAASGALGAALSAADALSSVREHASQRATAGRSGAGAAASGPSARGRFAAADDSSDSEGGDGRNGGARRGTSAGAASPGWPSEQAWTALASALAPPVAVAVEARRGSKAAGSDVAMQRFLPPHRADLPRASGLDADGTLAALREAERQWLEAPAARADAALAAMRVASSEVERVRPGAAQGSRSEAARGAGAGGGPEEESDEEDGEEDAEAAGVAAAAMHGNDDDDLQAPPRLGQPAAPLPGNVRVGGGPLVTGPAVSDLWADSDSSDDDDGGAGASAGSARGGVGSSRAAAGTTTTLPLVTLEQDEGEEGSDDEDDDDFGAFGARAAAKAARSAPSRRRKRGARNPAPEVNAKADSDEEVAASTVGGDAETDETPTAVAVMGFPQLRQLSVAGYSSLGTSFGWAVCRMAPPSLRRVDCRGTAVKPSQARDIAAALSRRERAAFRMWADAAAAESAAVGEHPVCVASAPEDDLTAVVRGGSRVTRPCLSADADEDSHAWAMSSPADAEAMAEEGMRCDEMASEWCDGEADSPGAAGQLDATAQPIGEGPDAAGERPLHRAWLDGEHADDPIVFGSARPEPSATSILVAAGPRAMHMQGRSAVDAVEDRGAMTPCQLDCVWEAAVELLGIGE